MSMSFTPEGAGLETRIAVIGEETVAPGTAERGAFRGGRVQPDFNPLMERVMRAQKLAEGRLYRISYQE